MSIDFPASPLVGSVFFDAASGTEWRYDGQGWVRTGMADPTNLARLDLPNNFQRANTFEDDVTLQQDLAVMGSANLNFVSADTVNALHFERNGVEVSGVPAGGLAGQHLAKNSAADFDLRWENPAASQVPVGGGPGQVLTKITGTDYDAGWLSLVGLVPLGGTLNQVLAKASGSDRDLKWYDLPHDLPPGGAANQILAKLTSADRAVGWVTPPTGIPAAGSLGYVLTKRTAADYDVNWQALPTFSGLSAGTIADQKAATNTAVASTPGRQKYDPRHAKGICIWSWNGTTLTNNYTVGVTISRSAVGLYSLALSPAAANANNLGCNVTLGSASLPVVVATMTSRATNAIGLNISRATGSGSSTCDPDWGIAVVYGDWN